MSSTTVTTTGAGLEGVVAGESEICYIDGYAGVLSYRGYNIHTLAEHATFEEVIWLLWKGTLPKQSELDQLKADLFAQLRRSRREVMDFLKANLKASPMDVLRTAVSMLSLYDPLAKDMSPEANQLKATKLMAQTSTIVSSFGRLRAGQPVIAPDAEPELRRQFPLLPDRQEARQGDGACFRRRAHAACRSRIERFHIRRARHGGHAFRYLFLASLPASALSKDRCTAAPTKK